MKVVKLDFQYNDNKYSEHGSYTKIAINVDAAVKYIEQYYPNSKDITKEYLQKYPYISDDSKPFKVYTHVKERVDEEGDWDYPVETDIRVYFEDVIE